MQPRYRIAMVAACPFPSPRGTPIRILRLAEALALRGHEVHVVTYHLGESEPPACLRVHRVRRVSTYRKLSPGPTYQKLLLVDMLLCAKLREVLRSHTIDVVHAHHYEGLLVARAAPTRGLPLVYDAHTLLGSELPTYGLHLPVRVKERLGRFLDRHLPRRADHVIAVTEDLRGHLLATCGLRQDDVTTIGNGVEFWPLPAETVTTVPSTHAARILAYAGNLAAYQGLDLLLRIFARVRRERPDVRLRIATESPDGFEPYRRLAEELDVAAGVELQQTDFVDLPRVLSRADVLLNPRPPCDGLPLKLLNYMAAGKPIVSFAGSGKGLRHESNALLVADGDVAGFAAAVMHLLRDPHFAAQLGTAARADAMAIGSWDEQAQRVEGVYGRLLQGERSGGEMGRKIAMR